MAGREHYTRGGFEAMKEKLAKSAINRAVYEMVYKKRNPNYFVGSPEEGYRYSWFEEGFEGYRLPPVDRAHAGPRPITVDYDGNFRPEPVQDVWAEIYEPWFTAIDEVFQGWDELPDERDFYQLADKLRSARAPLGPLAPAFGAVDSSDLDVLHSELGIEGDNVLDPTPSAAPRSAAIEVFRNTYAIPLQPVIAQQNWLIDILATQLDAEGKMWQRARRLVMEIGHQAKLAFDPESFDVAALIDLLGGVNNAIGFIPDIRVQVATKVTGLVLDGVELFLKAIEDKPPPGEAKIEETLSGATTQDVISRLRSALAELNSQISEEELAVFTMCDDAVGTTYEPSRVSPGAYHVTFNLPAPELLTETDSTDFRLPSLYPIDVDTRAIRRAAGVMPAIAGTLEQAAGNVEDLDPSPSMWLRPGFIGFTQQGPYDAWKSLLDRVPWLLQDTAGEVRAAGEHLVLAMNLLDNADAASQEALDKHARDVADIAAADPRQPSTPGRPSGPQP
ncbi:MAG TPA: hypothetical protein VNQ53_06320 [Nocardioides sp.]|nr:hypothetical protein [Nocardioides sp.]